MLRDLLRTIGAACIIAGTALYFMGSPDGNAKDDANKDELHEEISILQNTLNRTEEELAKLQLATSAAEKPTNEDGSSESEEASDPESSAPPLIKTLLHIEPGATSAGIAYQLERSGIIKHATEFENYLIKNELSGKLQIGEYDLNSSMSVKEIAKMITN